MVTHYIHRGLAKKSFKENTLSAFKYSFKKRYGIETDLQVTKDDQLICFHDFNLRRKFNLNKNVKDINYSTLKKISNKRKAPVPKLEDLLRISRNKYPLLNLYKLNKKLNLGLLFLSTSNLRTIKSKSKKLHVKFLGLEKSFLSNKKLAKIRKPIFYYTVKKKYLFKKYKNSKNLIFENL